jgi:hypothetical protein
MAPTKGGTPPTKTPTHVRSTTGGNDDGDGAEVFAPGATDGGPSGKSRKAIIKGDDFELSPLSLVGSWFHRLDNDRMVWQGVVVGEVAPATYLLQIDRLDVGADNVQRLVPLSALVNDEDGYDWRFYDTEREAQVAYAAWVASERDRV